MTCNQSFSELTSHTMAKASPSSWPAFCRSIFKSKTEEWIGCTTRADPVAQVRNSGILVYQLRLPVFQSERLEGVYIGQDELYLQNCFRRLEISEDFPMLTNWQTLRESHLSISPPQGKVTISHQNRGTEDCREQFIFSQFR